MGEESIDFGDRVSECSPYQSSGYLLAGVDVLVQEKTVGTKWRHSRSTHEERLKMREPCVGLVLRNTRGGAHCRAWLPPELAVKVAQAVARKAVEAGAPASEGLETQLALAVLGGDRAAALALRDRLAELGENT